MLQASPGSRRSSRANPALLAIRGTQQVSQNKTTAMETTVRAGSMGSGRLHAEYVHLEFCWDKEYLKYSISYSGTATGKNRQEKTNSTAFISHSRKKGITLALQGESSSRVCVTTRHNLAARTPRALHGLLIDCRLSRCRCPLLCHRSPDAADHATGQRRLAALQSVLECLQHSLDYLRGVL